MEWLAWNDTVASAVLYACTLAMLLAPGWRIASGGKVPRETRNRGIRAPALVAYMLLSTRLAVRLRHHLLGKPLYRVTPPRIVRRGRRLRRPVR
jgi:hypothetical protein